MEKKSIMAGLGDFYSKYPSGLSPLPFVYNNIDSLVSSLATMDWQTYTPLLDSMASVQNIKDRLMEAIKNGKEDQWLLFYFTGHASKYYTNPTGEPITFCVTYYDNLTEGQYPSLNNFFSGVDYEDIVRAFGEYSPRGHLITILDCCYAYGIITDFVATADYHTVIAATAENYQALYSDNSLFFKEFKKVLSQPLNAMEPLINSSLRRQRVTAQCIVRPAPKFELLTL